MGKAGFADCRQISFENLEARRLLSTQDVSAFGATPNDGADDRAAIQAAIDAAKPGDSVAFGAGTYDVRGTLNVKTGRSLHGSSGLDTTLKFANDRTQFGIGIEPNASNVKIVGLKLVGAGIQLSYGSGYKNISILDNEITEVVNGQAIQATAPSDGLIIEHNNIHDADIWGYDIFNADNLSVSYNIFKNIKQIGHLERPHDNVKLNYNLGVGLIRMGHEVQTQSDNLTSVGGEVIGNVIYGWRDWYWDSFGLSIVARQKDWVIKNNYIRGDYTGRNLSPDGGGAQRMGFGIEIGGFRPDLKGTPASDNIVGGAKWASHLVASLPNHVFSNNKLYGKPVWNWIGANPGNPASSWSDVKNAKEQDLSRMPSPPKISGVGPRSGAAVTEDKDDEPQNRSPDEVVNISDLKRASAKGSLGVFSMDETHGGGDIMLGGKTYNKGIGVAGNSEIVYNVGGKFTKFHADIGINDHLGSKGSVVFQVWADGKKVYDSGIMTGATLKKGITVKLDGVKKLKLVTTDAGDGYHNDQAVWASARLISA